MRRSCMKYLLSKGNKLFSFFGVGSISSTYNFPSEHVLASAVHILKLERYREDQHGPCARMTRKIVKRSTFFTSAHPSLYRRFLHCTIFLLFSYRKLYFPPCIHILTVVHVTHSQNLYTQLHVYGRKQILQISVHISYALSLCS